MSRPKILMNQDLLEVVIQRLCYQLIERYSPFDQVVFIGIQPRGVFLLTELEKQIKRIVPDIPWISGVVDPTFYRDDFRRGDKQLLAHTTKIPVHLDGCKVVLVDDVLYTGRTIRASLEALMEYGRPESIDLLVLINRKFTRQVPIEPAFVGKSIDQYDRQKVKVLWQKDGEGENQVVLSQE